MWDLNVLVVLVSMFISWVVLVSPVSIVVPVVSLSVVRVIAAGVAIVVSVIWSRIIRGIK